MPLPNSIYFVIISLIMTAVVLWTNRRAFRLQYSGSTALDLFFVVTLAGGVGARLVHVFFEEPQYYFENPMRIFFIWQGGFVYYGGLIFGFLSAWIYLRLKSQSLPLWLDFFTPIVSLSYAAGRVACFLTGCCYGKMCSLPWAVDGRHPTQLYAVALELLLFFAINKLEKTTWKKAVPGRLFAVWLSVHSLNRIVIELFRDDPRGPSLAGLSLSLLLSVLFLLTSLSYLKLSQNETQIKN